MEKFDDNREMTPEEEEEIGWQCLNAAQIVVSGGEARCVVTSGDHPMEGEPCDACWDLEKT